tara:strand:+ start:658 stop:1128 length:471 start_codon:yes stop_codon:yes gene_type:complete
MKLTESQLKQIIKEELGAVLSEAKVFDPALGFDVDVPVKPKAKLAPEPEISPEDTEFDGAMAAWDDWREWMQASDDLDYDDSDVVLLVKWMASRSRKYGGRKYIHLLPKFIADAGSEFSMGDVEQAVDRHGTKSMQALYGTKSRRATRSPTKKRRG